MCKKLVVVAVAVVLGFVIVKHSLFQAWWKDLKDPISPELRIKELRVKIGEIKDQVKQAIDTKVKIKVELKDLEGGATSLKTQKDTLEKDLAAMTEALDKATTQVVYQGKTVSEEKFRENLDRVTRQYTSVKESYDNRARALETKREVVEALDKQIRKMQQKETDLLALADKLEAKLQQLKLKQMENSVAVDDSKVSECEALAKQIEKRLAEEDFKAEEYANYGLTNSPEPKKETHSREDVLKAAREALGQGDSKAVSSK